MRLDINRFKSLFNRARSYQPLTTRGVVAAICGIWALYAFAFPESDIIAYILGGTLIGIVVVSAVAILYLYLRLKKTIQAQILFSAGENFSGREIPSGIVLQGSSLPPFFTLTLSRVFEHPGAFARPHVVSGAEPRRSLVDTVVFPHRGLWVVSGISVTLRDALGFISFSWSVPCAASVEISAVPISIQPLPIMAASSRAGDQVSQAQERSGDLFDIKAYDPSDGITRVLWKTYARSGQLVVRRPEPAVVPEGEVAIYVVASKDEDYVVGAFLSYLNELERGNITVIFGTDGMKDAAQNDIVLRNNSVVDPTLIRSTLNRTVWHSQTGTGTGAQFYLEQLDSQKRYISRLVVFGPEEDSRWFNAIEKAAQAHRVALTIVIVPRSIVSEPIFARQTLTGMSPVNTLVKSLRAKRRRIESRPAMLATARPGIEVTVCQSSRDIY